MKVLHIGLMVNKNLNVGLSKAFRTFCDEYHEIELNKNAPEEIRKMNFVPNIVFVQIQSNVVDGVPTCGLLNESMRYLRQAGAYVINWTGDIRLNTPAWMLEFESDLTAFSNLRDVRNVRSSGKKADFLQIGIDPQNFRANVDSQDVAKYHYNRLTGSQIPDIVFMGNHSGQFPLSKYRKDVTNQLAKRYGSLFGTFGGGYENHVMNLNATPDNPERMQLYEAYIYNRAKIAISVSHFNEDRYFSDRLLRCVGSGCFTISHEYKGINIDWKVGEEIESFIGIADLFDKIDFYLDNAEDRELVALNGYRKVHSSHTYDQMVNDIFHLYIKNKS